MTVLTFVVLLSMTDKPAADMPAGKLTGFTDVVTIKKPGAEKAYAVNKEDTVLVGDILRTGEKARAQVTFIDDSFVNLSSDTLLMVNQYIYDHESNRRKAVITVPEGVGRFIFYKKRHNNSLFTVEAGNALITGNIADFAVMVSPRETEVAVLDGMVNVKNIATLTVGEIRVSMNQLTIVKEKTPPSKPIILGSKQKRVYIRDTTVH